MGSTGRLGPVRKIGKISEDVECLVPFRIDSRFFVVTVGARAAEQIGIRIGSGFGINFLALGITAGLTPPEALVDPWFSRPMRKALGLSLPERAQAWAFELGGL